MEENIDKLVRQQAWRGLDGIRRPSRYRGWQLSERLGRDLGCCLLLANKFVGEYICIMLVLDFHLEVAGNRLERTSKSLGTGKRGIRSFRGRARCRSCNMNDTL